MTFEEFVLSVQGVRLPKGLRRGQFLVNELHRVRLDLAKRLTAEKDYDPFYDDKRLPAFWDFVMRNW